MTKKILITGGPVHAYLDDVKIITNKFRGGMMSHLASRLAWFGEDVTYLCSKGSKIPKDPDDRERPDNEIGNIDVIYHDGFGDYRHKVCQLSKQHNAVILGAAVANLIPADRIRGKFPSHNYGVGDRIPIDFTIAPRVIDEVKIFAPNTHLFGFKLLSGAPREELIDAAYDVVLSSRATAVFANDASNLDQKYAVTKERAVHPYAMDDLASFILEMIEDEYYHTASVVEFQSMNFDHSDEEEGEAMRKLYSLLEVFSHRFVKVRDFVFGSAAVRFGKCNSFVTTRRGKNETASVTSVYDVDHMEKIVYTYPGEKATLNAPLFNYIFQKNLNVETILHFHEQDLDLETQKYAPPGTVRDTARDVNKSFNIENHGCILLLNKDGETIK